MKGVIKPFASHFFISLVSLITSTHEPEVLDFFLINFYGLGYNAVWFVVNCIMRSFIIHTLRQV
jgi:hypothetical protein